jgi:ATP synthase protein I
MGRDNLGAAQQLAVASQLGFVLVAAVLIGIVGGSFLDSKLGSSPFLMVIGALLGMIAGIYSVWQLYRFQLQRRDQSGSSGKE